MATWRNWVGAAALLVAAGVSWGQTYPLAEPVKAGDCFRVKLHMTLAGELKVVKDGKVSPINLSAVADHEFDERALSVASSGVLDKAARNYDRATALITVGAESADRTLRKERRLIVAQRAKEEFLAYSPRGPLTRPELELVGEHFDTLSLTGLLPGKAVSVGETWKVSNPVVQALCSFEGLTEQDLACKLEEVKDNVAKISVSGGATGIDLGALVKLTVTGVCRFDLNAKRLISLDWNQQDDRDQGPASPASSTKTTTSVTRSPVSQPASLSDAMLAGVPDGFEPAPGLTGVEYHDPKGRYDLVHGRDWQIVSRTDAHLVMRLMDRGDFVAQVTVTPWTKAAKGEHMTPEMFKEAMFHTPGFEAEKEVQSGEVPTGGDGRWIYRVSALGQMDGTPVVQNFYLVAGPEGDQVVLMFTMTPKKAEKLGDRDVTLAAGVELPKK